MFCDQRVRYVSVEVGKGRGYLKDYVSGDLIHDVDASPADEIAYLDPPAARLARGIFREALFGVAELSSEQPGIRKEGV